MTKDDNQPGTGFGGRLKEARLALRMTPRDAAARLHLNPEIIKTLESESFDNAPPTTFMRGYLKSYARLLNFSDDEINAALAELGLNVEPSSIAVSPLLSTTHLYKSDRYTSWITYLIILVLLVMVATWWNTHPHASLQNLTRSIQTQPAATAGAATATHPAATMVAPAQPISAAEADAAKKNIAAQQQAAAPVVNPAATSPAPIAVAPVNGTPEAPAPVDMAPADMAAAPDAASVPLQPDVTLPSGTVANNNATQQNSEAKHKRSHSYENSLLPEPGLDGS